VIPNGEGIERTSAPRGKATRRAEPGIGQILRQSQGFRGYYVCDAGDGVCISVSLFDDRDSATAANEKAFNWIEQASLTSFRASLRSSRAKLCRKVAGSATSQGQHPWPTQRGDALLGGEQFSARSISATLDEP
jgi:hypothetical protein